VRTVEEGQESKNRVVESVFPLNLCGSYCSGRVIPAILLLGKLSVVGWKVGEEDRQNDNNIRANTPQRKTIEFNRLLSFFGSSRL